MDELERIRQEKMKQFMEKSKGDKMEVEIEVNDNNFEEKVIEQSKKVPVVVDYWAVWCAPCLMLGPTLEKLAKEYNGKFILAKLNVDENPVTSQKYAVMSIPSVKMFKDGGVADEFVGAMPEPMVKSWLEKNIGKA
ncbi:MAG: thioredoxin [Candidatus Aenigmarchaeota archaeon]|nr:thioredoxin [Candidatus Aenigmarchaeota archaeon]